MPGGSYLPSGLLFLYRKGVLKTMSKLVSNVKKRSSGVTKKDKIIFGILLTLGLIPLLLMIVMVVLLIL